LWFDEWFGNTGRIVTGRRTFDIAGGWLGSHPLNMPFFVLTHHVPETVAEGETMGIFVTDGIESVLSQAKAAAEECRDVRRECCPVVPQGRAPRRDTD
jgi:dihydrofolate reductase